MVGRIRNQFSDEQIQNAIAVTTGYEQAAEYLGIPGKGSLVRYWEKQLSKQDNKTSGIGHRKADFNPDWYRESDTTLINKVSSTFDPEESIWLKSPYEMPGNLSPELNLKEDNSRILVISDMHIPYHHPDLLMFLMAVKNKYRPTRVICIGDEVDFHDMSFHSSDPDLDSAGTEIAKARSTIKLVEQLFPKMDLVHSNHGSMLYRRGKEHGIPRHMLRSYNEVLGVGNGWVWHEDLTIDLPNGQYVHFHHGRGSNVGIVSRKLGMSFVQGHYHSKFIIDYWGNPLALNWGMNVGCLIDDHSLAFAYNKVPAERPIIGLGLIIDSQPKLVPLVKNRDGRWTGELN